MPKDISDEAVLIAEVAMQILSKFLFFCIVSSEKKPKISNIPSVIELTQFIKFAIERARINLLPWLRRSGILMLT